MLIAAPVGFSDKWIYKNGEPVPIADLTPEEQEKLDEYAKELKEAKRALFANLLKGVA